MLTCGCIGAISVSSTLRSKGAAGMGVLAGDLRAMPYDELANRKIATRGIDKCLGKTAFHSFSHAVQILRRLARNDYGKVRVYRCPHCDLWHLGGT